MAYKIIGHHIMLGQPHIPPEPGRLERLLTWFRERWGKVNANGHANGHTNGNGLHKNGSRSVGGTRHLFVLVNPDVPEPEQVVEEVQWGIDVPLEQVLIETKALLDVRYAPRYAAHQEHVGLEL